MRPWMALGLVVMLLVGCGSSSSGGAACKSMPELGTPCLSGVGECSRSGKLECSEDGTTLVCSAMAGAPSEEVCDGVDNDCDGEVDQGIVPEPASLTVGVCVGAVKTCLGENGWQEPDYPAIEGFEEDEATCDGVDNDCDGQIDEQLPVPAEVSCLEAGVCSGGVMLDCIGGAWKCGYDKKAAWEEVEQACDGLDNDCDGLTDEDLKGGEEAGCAKKGVCSQGVKATCENGVWHCLYDEVPGHEAPEVSCDGLDNDCNGEVDAGLPAPMDESACLFYGVCKGKAVPACVNAEWTCDYSLADGYESPEATCDGLDNDCDGFIDEELGCPGSCEGVTAGSIRCQSAMPGSGTPAVDPGGVVYVTANLPENQVPALVALDPEECEPIWKFVPPAQDLVTCLSPMIRSDGDVLFPCLAMFSDVESPIYMVNPSGQMLSELKVPEGVNPAGIALAGDGTMYFGNRSCCGDFYALKPDGSVKWLIETGGSEFDGTPALGKNGLIYAGTWKFKGSPEEKVYAISDDGATGSIKWTFAPPENSEPYDTSGIMVNAAPSVGADGTVYVGMLGKLGDELATTLYALDGETGVEKWHYTAWGSHAALNTSTVIGAQGEIYFVSAHFGEGGGDPTTQILHAVAADGKALWQQPFAMPEFTWDAIPAIGADGNIYVAAMGFSYAVDGKTGKELWKLDVQGASQGTALAPGGAMYFMTSSGFYAVCTAGGGLAQSPWPKAMHDASNSSNAKL